MARRGWVALVLAGAAAWSPARSPMPAAAPPSTAMGAVETTRTATLTIEGAYTVEGSPEKVRVKRLLGDIHHLVSTEAWEGVGILDGSTYRGVFRHPGTGDVPVGATGGHIIDWSDPERPSVECYYTGVNGGQAARQRWRRISPPGPPRPHPELGDYRYVEVLPEVLYRVSPVYPEAAKRAGIGGTVKVEAFVLEDGSVSKCRVVASIPALDAAAVACVRRWRFRPALSNWEPIAVWVAVPIRFELPK